MTLQGVVTFPYSPKHLVLYQKFDFKPRALVAITARSLERREPAPPAKPVRGMPEIKRFSTYEEGKKKGLLARLRTLTGRIYRGLDLTKEIEIVDGLALGDTLLLEKDGAVLGFAICHTPGVSEAPQGALYVKYLAIDPARRRPEHFVQLLSACEDFGVNAGVPAHHRAGLHGLLAGVPDAPGLGLPRRHADAPHEAREERRLRARGGLRPRRLALTLSRRPATSGRRGPGGARRRRS